MAMASNAELSKFRRNVFPIYKHELGKFLPLTSIFFMISFIYSTLRSLKDIHVLEHAGAEVIYYLKLFGVTPFILLLTIVYNRLSKVVDMDRKFNIVIVYFFVFFGASYLFFIPNLEALQLNGLADRLIASFPTMKSLWECVRYWPLSLFYINAEAWGTMALGVLFWTFVNNITGVEQSKRFYSFLSLGAAVGLIMAGTLLKTCKDHVNFVLGICVGLMGIILVVYNSLAYNIQQHPENYQIEQRPKKKKAKLSFWESFKFLAKSEYLALIATLIICYGVVISLFESVWKAKIKALTLGNEGMLADIYGNQGIFSGVLSIVLIIFLSTPIMHRGWRFAASVTPAVTLLATIIFFSFLYFQDALGSVTALWGISPLSLAVTFGLINVVFIKAFKYTLFDPTKERAYIPLDEESKIRGKAAVDGVGSRLGKSLGSLIITFFLVPLCGSIHDAEYIIFFLIVVMLIVWLRAVRKLSVLFKQRTAEHEAAGEQ
jgi:ATP:ADP antiporter, AAA family